MSHRMRPDRGYGCGCTDRFHARVGGPWWLGAVAEEAAEDKRERRQRLDDAGYAGYEEIVSCGDPWCEVCGSEIAGEARTHEEKEYFMWQEAEAEALEYGEPETLMGEKLERAFDWELEFRLAGRAA